MYGVFPNSFIYVPPEVSWYPAFSRTLSYWANPEVITFSPFLIFLPFLSTIRFIKLYIFLYFLIGTSGIFLLSKRLGFSVIEAIIMIFLTVLNPWIMQHLAIGYTPWIQVCLIPLIIFMLLGNRLQIKELIIASILNALIIYGGGFHIFIWFNLATVLFYLLHSLHIRNLRINIKCALFLLMSGVLLIPKLVAFLSTFSGFSRTITSSYRSISDLLGLFTDSTSKLYDLPKSYNIYGVNFYDGSIYMGGWFVVILIVCMIFTIHHLYLITRKRSNLQSQIPPTDLLVLGIFFILLGWNGLWRRIVAFIPVLGLEIYPFRFSFIALFLFCVFVIWKSKILIRMYLPKQFANIFMVIVFLPTIYNLYNRNQMFNDVATSKKDKYSNYNIQEFFLTNDISTDLNQIIVKPVPDNKVILTWLDQKYMGDFYFQNTDLNKAEFLENGTLLYFTDRTKPIIIQPRNFNRTILIFIGLIIYTLIAFFVWKFQKQVNKT